MFECPMEQENSQGLSLGVVFIGWRRIEITAESQLLLTGDAKDIIIGVKGQQRLREFPEEGLQDDGRDVNVPISIKIKRFPCMTKQG